MKVAVAGKGGSGKSAIAGTLARMWARRGHRVLALDSDPMPGLAISLGLGALTDAMLNDAAERDPDGKWRLKKGIGPARAVTRYASIAPDGVRFLQFGKADDSGLASVTPSLNALYQVIHRLARPRALPDWTIVGDLPAGPRQTAFDWAPYAEAMLVVVEPTWQSVVTARRIARIARSRRRGEVLVVANKASHPDDEEFIAARMGEPPYAVLPGDPDVRAADRSGVAPIDGAPRSPFVRAVEDLADALERRSLWIEASRR